MKMKVKGVLLFIPTAVMVHVVVGATTTKKTTATPATTTTTATTRTTAWPRTTASPGWNLKGKMFTLSQYSGGVSLYPPSYSPSPSPTHYPGRRTTTPYSTSSYPAWTTASPSRGVSVCARYFAEINHQPFFTLSPDSSSRLRLTDNGGGYAFLLTFGSYYSNNLYFSSFNNLWSYVKPDFWTRVCVTVDTRRGVAQVFRDGLISVRKRLPGGYVWRGEPVIDFSDFDGQVTDVQVWDFPLRYSDIFSYMSNGDYSPYSGNVITWSHVSYSVKNNALLEDTYNWQEKRPIRGGDSQPGPMGEKMKKKFSNQRRRKERKREKL